MELQAPQEALPQFEELSLRNPVNSRKLVRQNNLTFPILSDPHNDVAAAFGLRVIAGKWKPLILYFVA